MSRRLFVEQGKPNGVLWTDDVCVSYRTCDKTRARALLSAMQDRFPNGIHESEERSGELSILGTVIMRQGPHRLYIHQKPFLGKPLERAGFGAGPDRGVQIPIYQRLYSLLRIAPLVKRIGKEKTANGTGPFLCL